MEPKDYTQFREHRPTSLLVIPPINESVEVNAEYSYLSTVTQPLAELGYYVYPVAVIDAFLKENGMPGAAEMHQIPLSKIDEIIGPDAVLYLTLQNYGSKYQVISTTTVVSAQATLIDVKTGTELWSGEATTASSSNGGGNIVASLVAAAVTQIINSQTDPGHNVSAMNNQRLFMTPDQGLLFGPYHEQYLSETFQ